VRRVGIGIGTILFAIGTPILPVLLFQTRTHFCDTPYSVNLSEFDLLFYDLEALRDIVQIICRQPPTALLPFEDLLFTTTQSVQEKRLESLYPAVLGLAEDDDDNDDD